MTQHASLKTDSVGARHRNVLKRHERVTKLVSQDDWGKRDSAYKLPKVKLIKMKVKKVKSDKEETPAGQPTAGTSAPEASKPVAATAKQTTEKSKGK